MFKTPPPPIPKIALFEIIWKNVVQASWNAMAHTQKPDLVFRRNGRVHLNRRRRQFSRLLAAELCASAVVMLDTPCSEVVWRLLATHSNRRFPLHFPPRASPYAITIQLVSTARQASDNRVWSMRLEDRVSKERIQIQHVRLIASAQQQWISQHASKLCFYTIHASNPFRWLAMIRAAQSSVSIPSLPL